MQEVWVITAIEHFFKQEFPFKKMKVSIWKEHTFFFSMIVYLYVKFKNWNGLETKDIILW